MWAGEPEKIGEIKKESLSLTEQWKNLKKYKNFGGLSSCG
jgi:hypothetical protein